MLCPHRLKSSGFEISLPPPPPEISPCFWGGFGFFLTTKRHWRVYDLPWGLSVLSVLFVTNYDHDEYHDHHDQHDHHEHHGHHVYHGHHVQHDHHVHHGDFEILLLVDFFREGGTPSSSTLRQPLSSCLQLMEACPKYYFLSCKALIWSTLSFSLVYSTVIR